MSLTCRIGLLCVLIGVPAATVAAQETSVDEGREQQVMERFLTLLEKNPKRGTALDRVYGYHVERGTLDGLLKSYEDRLAKDPGDGAAWMVLGLLQGQSGRDAAAVATLRKAEQVRGDDPLASYYLGQALILIGQIDAAAEAFERAITRKPPRADLLEIFQALGRVYQRAHQPDKALAVWDRLEARFPDDLRVQEQIAETLAEESEPARALPRYESLAKKTTDPYRKVQFSIEAAELKLKVGQRDKGLADFERLLDGLNPESWLYRDVRKRIEDSFLKNDDQAALAAYYEEWLKKSKEDVDAMARLSRTLATLGRSAEARTWLDKAVKLAPSRKELRLALIEQLVQGRKFSEAASQYEALAKTEPNNPDVLREWGRLILRDPSIPEPGRKQSAAKVWRTLLDARPNDAATAVQVADLFRQANMTVEAIALYKEAVELAPGSIQYHEYLGEYYHELKRPDDARAAWAGIASGKNRNAKNLGRLSEVLAGFGDKAVALKPITEACALDPDSFDLQFKRADLLFQLDRFDDALAQLANAVKIVDEPEQREAALDLEIKVNQANQTLSARADALQKKLDADSNATAEAWRTLARYREAEPKPTEALAAINKAIDLDSKAPENWIVAAHLHESGGNLGAAADAFRTLARLDRRTLTQSLTEVARLEVRLGRRDEALKAGRDLLAAAPGNPENYQFFADLCMQLGRPDEGLDALRRAVRVNGSDVKAVTALADALAKEFRTEEAIELFWRAFDKADDLDGKLAAVARLAELYLQRNQFDRLVARLERERRDAGNTPREATICLAKAYQASGDLASARQELERLLTSQTRDTQLLEELANLAETEGDLATAARYQKQRVAISPSEESSAKLAELYGRTGEMTEAEAIWTRLTAENHDPHRALQVIDQWLAHDEPDKALPLTETLLRARPDDWDALYREGVALAKLQRPEDATRRFRQLLDLKINDDKESALAKARKKSNSGRPAGTSSSLARSQVLIRSPLEQRINSAYQIRMVTGLEDRPGYSSTSQVNWSPADFGQARVAALAWLNVFARKDKTEDAFLDAARKASETGGDRARRDWFFLQFVRQDERETYEAARALALANPADPSAQWIYLINLSGRNAPPSGTTVVTAVVTSPTNPKDDTPPLSEVEIGHVLTAFRTLQGQRPELAIMVLDYVLAELKRAGRKEEETGLYREVINAANDP
ncbi:MAG: tetratricopeptide repeat protein, partial [Isosphaeraceae bacterium]